VAVWYYFRREVEKDQELFQGLVIAKLDALAETTEDTNASVKRLEQQIQKLLERSQLQDRVVRRSDSLSIRSDAERQLVQQVIAEYRSLPDR